MIEQTPEELMEACTHKEMCEMYLELRAIYSDLDKQFENLYALAQALRIERDILEKRLNESNNE